MEVVIRVGVSSCLLGNEVRYDGNHKRDTFIVNDLAPLVELVSVCPEVEMGMAIPRPPIRLEASERGVRLLETRGRDNAERRDYTDEMVAFARRRVEELRELELCGYIFKARSPTCGVFRVPIMGETGAARGRGVFAQMVTEQLPRLPVEEEGRLRDSSLREAFLERVFAYARLQATFHPSWKLGDLVSFHSREKLLLLAHKPAAYTELGQLVARGKELDREELAARYQSGFLAALATAATAGKHVNVIQHMLGYFSKHMAPGDRAELAAVVDDYHKGLVPLIVPVTLVRFFVKRHTIDYLAQQSYLNPHPKELMLRSWRSLPR